VLGLGGCLLLVGVGRGGFGGWGGGVGVGHKQQTDSESSTTSVMAGSPLFWNFNLTPSFPLNPWAVAK